eukprot:CAMPEP_0176420920 /NCGR_PEP_ID=MMETSP0127-20121128/8877_1 /TAXON_ID=938130 /ORGANISM="Platyophrya macrostoma, Strain WH" /LENGTH=277 /DNA_ID=CAMNT_0017801575 /DNA_START=36 /DNA_END=869 /DNA_ORIENTATION=+
MRMLLVLGLSVLLLSSAYGVKVNKQAGATPALPIGDLDSDITLTTLSITGGAGSDSVLTFNNGASSDFELVLDGNSGGFTAKNGEYSILVTDNDDSTLTLSSSTLTVQSINFNNTFSYQGTPQWKLAIQENFWNPTSGWSINTTTTCGGVTMLGGYGMLSTGNVTKAISGLPTHTVVRLVVSIHFIDAWEGEMAYLFADNGTGGDDEYLWTLWNDSSDAENDLSICGGSFGEAQFNNLIDVTFAHTDPTLNLIFGTTATDDPDVLSWGISSFEVYVL